jgi:hypothetical protein
MRIARFFMVIVITALAVPAMRGQDFPKPGPEHELLKKMEGNWDLTMKFAGSETKGKVTYKMELGGMWLVSTLEGEIFGQKFYGKGLDTYNAKKKKYVSTWFDSMTASPMVMEGTYDKEKKTLTQEGESVGDDGKPMKLKSITEIPDDHTINFSMYMGETKEPTFTIVYKRVK